MNNLLIITSIALIIISIFIIIWIYNIHENTRKSKALLYTIVLMLSKKIDADITVNEEVLKNLNKVAKRGLDF